jgi:hypothetical protein
MTHSKTQKNKAANFILSLLSTTFIYSCAPGHSESISQASSDIKNSLGCKDVKSKVFDSFYEMVDQKRFIPTAEELNAELDKKLDDLKNSKDFSDSDKEKLISLKKSIHQLVEAMLTEATQNPSLNMNELVQKLIRYEMGNQSDQTTIAATQKINTAADKVKALSQSLSLSCAVPASPEVSSTIPAGTSGKLTEGIKMVFATAYQSCSVLDLPPMSTSTPNVAGVVRTGTHADGIGGTRQVNDLKALQGSHYYIRGIASDTQCSDVKNHPLIYDYGGEPAVSKNTINFMQNAGSGTSVLGVDCSAYVSSAIAVAGLRYAPGLANKPIFIRQTASDFIDAKNSGFSCFDNITVTPSASVKPGDIIGVHGHVVAIDQIGADPFGLALVKTEAACSGLNYKNFDITITQSSPSKNAIGINKYLLKDYLDESGPTGKMTTAFVGMAKQACLAKFQNKSIKPSSTEWGFLRHKGTAECVATRTTMVGESCTQKCF